MAITYPLPHFLFTQLTHLLLNLCNHESSDEALNLSDLYRLSRTKEVNDAKCCHEFTTFKSRIRHQKPYAQATNSRFPTFAPNSHVSPQNRSAFHPNYQHCPVVPICIVLNKQEVLLLFPCG